MKRYGVPIISVLMIGLLVLAGCAGNDYRVAPLPEVVEATEPVLETPVAEIPAEEKELTSASGEESEAVADEDTLEQSDLVEEEVGEKEQPVAATSFKGFMSDVEPPKNINWITPAKVEIGNFYAGARAECPLYVHNGNNDDREFSVKTRLPDHCWEGFVDAPLGYESWVTVEASGFVLAPHETKEVLIVLEPPRDAVMPDKKWEFWIVVAEAKREMFAVELACRWLVTMRV